MDLSEVRTKYLEFFKARGHTVIPSASLVPENDPTTLFTGSGMQPLVPYLLGQPHPSGARLTDSQKCFRSMDIEEVGDNRHTTFFEMLGNWSLGDYFKQEQLPWFFEFLTDEVGLDPQKLYVTVFKGDESLGIPKDEVSIEIWKELFAKKNIAANVRDMVSTTMYKPEFYENRMQPDDRIFLYSAKKNWWSRSGVPGNMPAGEPGGPDSEVFYEFTDIEHDPAFGEHCHPNCDCGRFLEIGNNVFMQYIKEADGNFSKLPKQNVDFGGGLERILAAKINDSDVFNIDVFTPVKKIIEGRSSVLYGTNEEITRSYRIVLDHLRAATFLIGDGVLPSNKDQGYFVRRLIRRSVREIRRIGASENIFSDIAATYVESYKVAYPELQKHLSKIQDALSKESDQFGRTMAHAIKKLWNLFRESEKITGDMLYHFFTTEGFPPDLTLEEYRRYCQQQKIKQLESNQIEELLSDFQGKMKGHKEESRTGSEQKFKGGLADHGEITTMLHTCTHLMLAGLRKYLGDGVHQAGSNITAERTRFDFTYPEKVPREILDKVENYVNEAIQKKCPVTITLTEKEKAKADGVEGSFWEKYPNMVNVYAVACDDGTIYSQELCGGPHVENTGNIKGTFKIVKEEASSAGVRRIKAVLK